MAVPDIYMHSVKNVPAIFSSIREAGVPDRFTHEFLKQLGFTSSNDRSFPAILRALRFADDNGVPTERYKRFRDSSISSAVMAEALRDAYSDIFKVNEKAQTMSSADLTGAFKRVTGKTNSVAQKMASTFKALSALADWDAKSVAASIPAEPPADPEPAPAVPLRTGAELDGQQPLMPALHHDIHIHLPVSTEVKVYDAIFRSLREHFR